MGKHYVVTSSRIRRKSKKEKRPPSVNKYARFVPSRSSFYNWFDKTFRDLPIIGDRGEVLKAGYRVTFHGRLYALMKDTSIPQTAPSIPGTANKYQGVGRFKLVARLD